jgi:hypothetical protein
MPAADKAYCLFGGTSARPIFWQLLIVNVYHQCVIEKRQPRQIAQIGHACGSDIREVYRRIFSAVKRGRDALKPT